LFRKANEEVLPKISKLKPQSILNAFWGFFIYELFPARLNEAGDDSGLAID
jgi:hypothetical protein